MNLSPPGGNASLARPLLLTAACVLVSTWASAATISFQSNASNSSIQIPETGVASIYPSKITVGEDSASGFVAGATITEVKVFLSGLTHGYPDDLNFLLVGPTGASVMLLSDPGGSNALANKDLYFSDGFVALLPDATAITGTEYHATNWGALDDFPAPAPAGSTHGTDLSVFNSVNPFGDWKLYIHDDYNEDGTTDKGSLVGWRLDLAFTPVPTSEAAAALPEPGSLLLIGTGLAGLVRRRWRRGR